MYLLIPQRSHPVSRSSNDLHSIMYLLIRQSGGYGILLYPNLHSIMYLLIRITMSSKCMIINLHSIMYLLILLWSFVLGVVKRFTFHNVSINSEKTMIYVDTKNNLHSIMYLLIQSSKLSSVCSSKTFTFHNVSINSELAIVFQVTARHLHSIMYLLILKTSRFDHLFPVLIYIP